MPLQVPLRTHVWEPSKQAMPCASLLPPAPASPPRPAPSRHVPPAALPQTELGNFLERRLNDFLSTQHDKRVGQVVVRVVNIRNKTFSVNKDTLEYYQAKGEAFPSELGYRSKALFVFQKQKNYDMCFFG